MRSLKIKYLIGLIILLIAFNFNCGFIKSVLGPEDDDDDDGNGNGNGLKFSTNVEFIYERTDPFVSNEEYDSDIKIWIQLVNRMDNDWWPIQEKKMEKISKRKFKYIAEKIPDDHELWVSIYDKGKIQAEGKEFNARIVKVNGKEITKKINSDNEMGYMAAYFIIQNGIAYNPDEIIN